jgi:hypothetical protein
MADSWRSLVKLEKITHPMMAYMLLPWYLDTWEPIEDSCLRLYDKLANDIENTFCCVRTENCIIQGMAIAYKKGSDMIVWQVNDRNGRYFEPLLDSWGKSNGCDKMIMLTHRSPKAFNRAYGFELVETDKFNGKERHEMSRSL